MDKSTNLDSLREKYKRGLKGSPAASHLAAALLGETEGAHCLDDLAVYVDEEVAGIDVARTRLNVKRHLDLCPNCSAQYLALLATVLEEVEGLESPMPTTPRPDLSFLPRPSLSEIAQQIAKHMLTRLAPHQLPNLTLVAEPFFRRLAVAGEALSLERAYKPTLSSEPIEAFQVLVFAYFTSQALLAQQGTEWDAEVAGATHVIGHQMHLPLPVAEALAQAYGDSAAEWRTVLRPKA